MRRKLRTSWVFAGFRACNNKSLTFFGSGLVPSFVKICPKNDNFVLKKLHLLRFNRSPLLAIRLRHTSRFWSCSLRVEPNIMRGSDCSKCLAPETLLHVVAAWLPIVSGTIHMETRLYSTFSRNEPADRKRLKPLRRSSGV